MISASVLAAKGVVHHSYGKTTESPKLTLESLGSYFKTKGSDPMLRYIPPFTEAVLCEGNLCMLLREVENPFSGRSFGTGRSLPVEEAVGLQLACLAEHWAYYCAAKLDEDKPFLGIADFSLQNFGLDDNGMLTFLDLDNIFVMDGSLGTFAATLNVFNGYAILSSRDVDLKEESVLFVHRQFKVSMIIMFVILAKKALWLSKHPNIDYKTYCSKLDRPKISTDEQKEALDWYKTQFGVSLVPYLKSIYSGVNRSTTVPEPKMPLAESKERMATKLALSKSMTEVLNKVSKSTKPFPYTEERDCEEFVLGQGAYGTVLRIKESVPSLMGNCALKRFRHNPKFVPRCSLCSTKAEPAPIVHFCKSCKIAVCINHLNVAVEHNWFHSRMCCHYL